MTGLAGRVLGCPDDGRFDAGAAGAGVGVNADEDDGALGFFDVQAPIAAATTTTTTARPIT